MRLDVISCINHTSQPLGKVRLKQASDEFACIDRDLRREIKVANCNAPIHLVGVLIIERRIACQHLEDEDAESPPVDTVIMAD